MVLFKKISDQEVLKLVIQMSMEYLPAQAKGIVEGRYLDDGIELYFIPNNSSEDQLLS